MHCGSLPESSLSRRLHTWAVTSALAAVSWLWPSVAFTQELAIPGQNSLTDIEEIELVYIGIQTVPKIIVRGRQSANSFVLSSYRPPDGRLDL